MDFWGNLSIMVAVLRKLLFLQNLIFREGGENIK